MRLLGSKTSAGGNRLRASTHLWGEIDSFNQPLANTPDEIWDEFWRAFCSTNLRKQVGKSSPGRTGDLALLMSACWLRQSVRCSKNSVIGSIFTTVSYFSFSIASSVERELTVAVYHRSEVLT
jgi:hypothetical protein